MADVFIPAAAGAYVIELHLESGALIPLPGDMWTERAAVIAWRVNPDNSADPVTCGGKSQSLLMRILPEGDGSYRELGAGRHKHLKEAKRAALHRARTAWIKTRTSDNSEGGGLRQIKAAWDQRLALAGGDLHRFRAA